MDEVDEFLAHYGVKGMKWGQRKGVKGRADRVVSRKLNDAIDFHERVASGKGSASQTLRVAVSSSLLTLARNKGIKGTAAKRASEGRDIRKRLESGEATFRDKMNTYGQLTLVELARGK